LPPSPMDSEALRLAAKTVTTRRSSGSVLGRGMVSYTVLEAWCSAASGTKNNIRVDDIYIYTHTYLVPCVMCIYGLV
jgi:hypothetical protein